MSRKNAARRGNTRKNKGNGRKEEKTKYIENLYPTHKTVILPAVLYWCEKWSLTLKERH
jgi:hypothetical protein